MLIKNAKALVGTHPKGTLRVAGASMAELPMLEHGWMMAENGVITALGTEEDWPGISDWNGLEVIDATDRYVLPGWCDPHTHSIFAAPREGEFVDRINGLGYEEIAAKGGCTLNSARKLRAMGEEELYAGAKARLEEMMHQGTVAVEIKSGYGLDAASELKMLRVAQRLKETLPLQVRTTLLAAHALPPEYKDNRAGYVDLIIKQLIPQVAGEGLAQYVDCFCERNYFTAEEMGLILEAGNKHGLKGKVHVNQFSSMGGIQAAVEHNALSVDHLEVMEDADIESLRGTRTFPTLLPSCSFFLGIPYGPARELIEAGLPVALATDHNPGSTPSGNMNFVVALACIKLRMSPEQAVQAATINAAAAMGLAEELGSLTVGKRASCLITKPVPSLAYLPYAFGQDHIDTVIIDGRTVRTGETAA
ncbi:MAG TPA: imidazolonepropionase [Flavobacteriales bacterium]|nr:imidazolonepropionase [Flavobacteriales bacterium]